MPASKAPALHWSKKENRWRFRYRNKNFAVSPRMLRCENSPFASKEAAERWRDERVLEADNAADAAYSNSAAREHLLCSRDHAERCLSRMEKVGQEHAVRQWRNILAVIYSQLADQASFPAGYDADPEIGLDSQNPPSIVDRAKNRLLQLDFQDREKYAQCFQISEQRLHAPLPAEKKALTVSEAVAEFLTSKKIGGGIEYVANLRRDLKRLSDIVGSDLLVTALDANAVRKIHLQVEAMATTEKPWSDKTKKNVLSSMRQFIGWCATEDIIETVPKNLKRLTSRVTAKEIKVYSAAEFQLLLSAASDDPTLRLALLLMANCGYTQQDVADLKRSEVANGRITRKRSKEKHHENVPVVSYKLWPITHELLTAEMSRHDHPTLAILGDSKPLKAVKPSKRDGISKKDYLGTAFKGLRTRHTLPSGRTMKHIRKTSSSLIADKFGDGIAKYFLGQVPVDVAEIHYLRRNPARLDEAVEWVGKELCQLD